MSYHMDRECNEAIVKLLDALCSWERDSRRGSTLILIPHYADEKLVVAEDGKPVSYNETGFPLEYIINDAVVKFVFESALRLRAKTEASKDD